MLNKTRFERGMLAHNMNNLLKLADYAISHCVNCNNQELQAASSLLTVCVNSFSDTCTRLSCYL